MTRSFVRCTWRTSLTQAPSHRCAKVRSMSVRERLDVTNKRRLLGLLAGAVLLLLLFPLLYAVAVGLSTESEARVTCPDGSTMEIPTDRKVEDVCGGR